MSMNEALAAMAAQMPVALGTVSLGAKAGLVVVDEVNGFCTPGFGPLAPAAPDVRIAAMIAETDLLARAFADRGNPIMVFRDTHVPGRAEPPYPPHCEIGTGQEELVQELAWLEACATAEFLDKDVINGFVGGMRPDGSNAVLEWISRNGVEQLVVVGICTDICVADFVLTMMSARNHHHGDAPMLPRLRDVIVHEPACATYDLPLAVARGLGLPDVAAHPQALAHHMGLAMMQARGAVLTERLVM